MKKMIKMVLVVVFTALASTSVMAEGEAGTGPNPFTDCGIGAALFPNTGWAAVTSNVIWDIGITALTSATLSPETCQGKKTDVAKFINETYDNILAETAIGEGKHLTTMLQVLACEDSAHGAILREVRDGFASAVTTEAEDYYLLLIDVVDSSYAQSCPA